MKFDCPCGQVLDLTSDDGTYAVVLEKHYPKLVATEQALTTLDPESKDFGQRARELGLSLGSLKQRLCECPRCGRLLWFRSDLTQPAIYWLDEE